MQKTLFHLAEDKNPHIVDEYQIHVNWSKLRISTDFLINRAPLTCQMRRSCRNRKMTHHMFSTI